MQKTLMSALIFCGFLPLVVCAGDFQPTERECHEGSDFIKNAVIAQNNNGYSREKLLGRFDDDVMILSGMDPQKRWFIRSPGATRFLRDALVEALVLRRTPKDQASVFLRSCMSHVLAVTPDDL